MYKRARFPVSPISGVVPLSLSSLPLSHLPSPTDDLPTDPFPPSFPPFQIPVLPLDVPHDQHLPQSDPTDVFCPPPRQKPPQFFLCHGHPLAGLAHEGDVTQDRLTLSMFQVDP
jgi:hypothetical protein